MAASSSAACPSNFTSAGVNLNSYYDVFINHRGPDVKKTFASHLYRALRSYGFKVFLDQQELQQGDYLTSQIEGAIRTASVHVAIFSKRYAESTWCLNELLLMLESEVPIIPVFYEVKPTELRWTHGKDGVYARALHKLEEKTTYDPQTQGEKSRYSSATIESWRKALSDVAGICGFDLEACNHDEGELLDNVVESVLRKVKKTPLNVAKYPSGLGEKVRDFENKVLLQHQQGGRKPQAVGIVGIVGLGGVGKTTLAKEFFNGKCSHYNRSCFLFDVRENVGKGSLILLQRNLLRCLTGSDMEIDNKDEGTQKLKKHLTSSPILLIIDDVDSVDQVDALVPNQTFIHSNSLILITSRNEDVLTNWGVEKSSIYKLNGLNEQHSLELFCWHAFNQSCPLPGFDSLVHMFLKSCNGLPLSLKVFGALLRGNNDMPYWHEQVERLEKTIPGAIQERLLISYESLSREEKHIFLDIACFFIGEKRDTAIRIWDCSGWKGWLGFQSLQNKCLVEVDRWNIIHMHDHLRDLGRDVAQSSSPRRLSRWTEGVIDDLLGQSSVITVRGIKMVLSDYSNDDVFDAIGMRRLQLLDTEDFLLNHILRRVEFPNLIWVHWKMCPYSSLPSWIPTKNLRVFRVSGTTLETLWQDDLQLPKSLEELWADRCVQLKSIPELGRLTKLKSVRINGCSELEELPSMETLVSLQELWTEECVKLKTIQGLAQLTRLRILVVRNCSELQELPSMKTLVSLEHLCIGRCARLKSIRELAQLTNLRFIIIYQCSELEELSMDTLVSLDTLWIAGCVKLKSIGGFVQLTKLRILSVLGCSELEELPSMETLVALEELWAGGCSTVKILHQFNKKSARLSAKMMVIAGLSMLEEQPSMETVVSMHELFTGKGVKLKSIRRLEQLTKLRELNVAWCSELEELPSMEAWVSLQWLWATACVKLKSIPGLAQLTKLRFICVTDCCVLEELPSMETLVCLEELWARRCVKLKSIRGLAQATKLRNLILSGCTELEEVEGVEHLTWLEMLDISYCPKLQCPVWEQWTYSADD